jgi:hypothetical protein
MGYEIWRRYGDWNVPTSRKAIYTGSEYVTTVTYEKWRRYGDCNVPTSRKAIYTGSEYVTTVTYEALSIQR